MPKITPNCINDIVRVAHLQDVVGELITLKQSGASLVGTCPFCNKPKKFSVNKAKDLWGCFSCDTKGSGAIGFIMKIKTNGDYIKAVEFLANKYNVVLEYENNEAPPQLPKPPGMKKADKAKHTDSFRDIQLAESGLSDADQKYNKRLPDGGKNDIIEIDRYVKGSVMPNWMDIDSNGDDMVMHYMDLHGNPMTYLRKGTSRNQPLIRVRYANPALHTDGEGRPMKYQSPYGSGTHVWINQTLRNKYESGAKIETLYIQEGEKKADKATKHGITSVGVMGIHNIAANKQLPREFELIIKKCEVQNVVFVVDGDYLDIGNNINSPVDQRPKSFLRAILNFHDYFYALNNSGINLNIYFAYIKPENKQKGIDDLLHVTLKGKEAELLADFSKTLIEPTGQGKYINCHKITNTNEYKLRTEHFHLGNNEAFAQFHKEKLAERKVFKIGRENFKFAGKDEIKDKEGNFLPEGTLVLAQPLSSEEEFWEERRVKRGDTSEIVTSFKYVRCVRFLNNRKFGRHSLPEGEFNFVKVEDNNVVQVVKNTQIKDYLMDFTRNALQKENVLEMLYKGSKMYLSDNLNNLDYMHLKFHNADKGVQYLYFTNTFWKITADGVEEKPISDLDGHVWKDKIKQFAAERLNPLVKVGKSDEGKFRIEFPSGVKAAMECEFYKFIVNTSNFYWRETHEGFYAKGNHPTTKRSLNNFELEDLTMHFISKCCAIGFMLHTYFDPNKAKCVVAMDGKLTEVGSSNGRSGKSLLGDAFDRMLPTITIPGKQKDLTEDRFIWDGVTERTRIVFIDDVRVNFDFEAFFSNINGYWKINPKGGKPFQLQREDSPKIFITTNHALNGEGGSFRDRQFLIAFSDFYNEHHRPIDEHGALFFDEWDFKQYNLFYNFMACCLQIYFEHGLVSPPMERLEQRRLRQQIGENFIDWADLFYDKDAVNGADGSSNLNKAIPRSEVVSSFQTMFPESRKYIGNREIKKKLQQYCIYRKLMYNPGYEEKGGLDKRNGVEYFTVANDSYSKPH